MLLFRQEHPVKAARGVPKPQATVIQSGPREGPKGEEPVDRAEKQELVTHLNGVFSSAASVVVTHYTGLTVAELTKLRGEMAKAGAGFKVTKNRLAKIALEGTPCTALADMLTGPTAIAYSDDPVAASKVVSEFAEKNEKLVIIGGVLQGKALDAQGVQALAKLPSLDELRAKIVGLVSAPATKVAGVLQAPVGQLARVIGAYAAKNEAA
jgi:large subunit ribosomal protein L10